MQSILNHKGKGEFVVSDQFTCLSFTEGLGSLVQSPVLCYSYELLMQTPGSQPEVLGKGEVFKKNTAAHV